MSHPMHNKGINSRATVAQASRLNGHQCNTWPVSYKQFVISYVCQQSKSKYIYRQSMQNIHVRRGSALLWQEAVRLFSMQTPTHDGYAGFSFASVFTKGARKCGFKNIAIKIRNHHKQKQWQNVSLFGLSHYQLLELSFNIMSNY